MTGSRLLVAAALLFGGVALQNAVAQERGMLALNYARTISYQGYATDQASKPLSGEQKVRVSLFEEVSGGKAVWTQLLPAVQFEKGIFNMVLGADIWELDFRKDYYLEVVIESFSNEPLGPRTPLTAVPYALHAEVADRLSPNAPNVVTSLNGKSGPITLQGGGGTTISANGNVLTIVSSGGEGGTGIQGVQNNDGALKISDGFGPIATLNVNDGGITSKMLGDGSVLTAHLGDGSVTTQKVADGSVTTQKVADGSVTLPKLNTIGATQGQFVMFNGSTAMWSTPAAGGLVLPYAGAATSNSTAFAVTQNGLGRGGHFLSTDTSGRPGDALVAEALGSADAFYAISRGSGFAINSLSNGTGGASRFIINNTTSAATGLYVGTNGTGTPLIVSNNWLQPGGTVALVRDIAVFQKIGVNKARIDNNGKGYFNGGTQNSGADIAEAFDVEGDRASYEPGDVMVISTKSDRTMDKSSEPYSILVAGVYATKPGVLLTERGSEESLDDLVPMGVVGVIPTKVTSENGAIHRGDLLVTSSTPGHAMKADREKVEIGMVIGKALEDFDGSGNGFIKVLVNVK